MSSTRLDFLSPVSRTGVPCVFGRCDATGQVCCAYFLVPLACHYAADGLHLTLRQIELAGNTRPCFFAKEVLPIARTAKPLLPAVGLASTLGISGLAQQGASPSIK